MKNALSGLKAVLLVLGAGACVFGAPMQAVQAQVASEWKTVTNKEAGISISMPYDALVTPSVKREPETGATVALLKAEARNPASIYLVVAIHLDKKAVDVLRQQSPDEDPMEVLFTKQLLPLAHGFLQEVQKNPESRVTRKPIVWRGLKGEEITGVLAPTSKGTGGQMLIRMVRSADTVYMLLSGERTKTAAGQRRMAHFFQSFKVVPVVPSAATPKTPDEPAAPTSPNASGNPSGPVSP